MHETGISEALLFSPDNELVREIAEELPGVWALYWANPHRHDAADEARAHWPDELDTWYRHPDWAAIPRGETLQQVLTRAVAALREVIRHHPDDTIVLVAHDSVNRVLLLHALELPLSRYWRFKQNPCCINELDLSADGFTILGINQTDHLRQAK